MPGALPARNAVRTLRLHFHRLRIPISELRSPISARLPGPACQPPPKPPPCRRVSASPSTPPDAAPRRDRVVRLTVAASVGAKVISVACTLAQVPIALHALGPEAYGLWITLMSIMIMLNFVDFGLGVGMQKAMAAAFGREDPPQMRRAFYTGVATLAGLSVIILAVGIPAALWFNWGGLLKITDESLRPLAGPALAITISAFAIGLPFNAASRLAMAAQRGWLHAAWIALGSITTLGAVALAARAHWGFLPFLALTTLLPAVQGAGLWLHLRHKLGWKGWPAKLLPLREWRALAGDSLLFAVPQLGLAFVQAAPPLALSLAAGPVAATAFNLLQRLFSPVTQGQIMYLTPLWPAMTEAHVRGDSTWVRRAFQQSLLVSLLCILALGLLTGQSGRLLQWWVGDASLPAIGPLAWLTCGWFAAQILWQPMMYLLVALGRLPLLAGWSVAGLGLSLAGMAGAVAYHGGAEGVIGGGLIGLALGGLPGLLFAALRVLSPARSGARSP